nr:hypothetical protein [Tanacetum cinerariifolium]
MVDGMLGSCGWCTIKSGYKQALLCKENGYSKAKTSSNQSSKFWTKLWNIDAQPKSKLFLWKAISNFVATMDNLFKRKFSPNPTCPLCQSCAKMIEHLLFECAWTRPIWFGSSLSLRSLPSCTNIYLHLQSLIDCTLLYKEVSHTISIVATICWSIWKARNSFVYEHVDVSPHSTLALVNAQLLEFDMFMAFKQAVCNRSISQSSPRWISSIALWLRFMVETKKYNSKATLKRTFAPCILSNSFFLVAVCQRSCVLPWKHCVLPTSKILRFALEALRFVYFKDLAFCLGSTAFCLPQRSCVLLWKHRPEWSMFVMIVKQQHKLDEVSYHKLFDILKQYQKEVNELRAERLARNANPLALVATAQANQDPKPKRVKDSAYHKERMLLRKQAEKGVPLQNEQYDWLEDMDEEIDEQELEAHYSYMAKIQEVPTADTGTNSEPLEQVQNDTGYNVFANDLQHSKQSESISNTCLVETDDSNVIPDSPDMCDEDIQNDQNDVESDDERVALANLISNLKLDVDENKKIQKQLKKANTTLTQELKECKTILAETGKTLGESNSVRDSCLVALQNKQTEFEKYKAFNDRTVDYDKLELQVVAATDDSPAIPEHTTPEWSMFVTIVKQQHKLDEVSYYKLYDILKQYQKEVNELRAERLARNANPLALVATAQANQDPNKNVDTTPRYKNDNQTGQFRNQRMMNVVGARENVGSSIVQQSGKQCFNCKEFRHFAKECRKPKRVKDFAYHKERMLLCKQAEKGVPLQDEQYDWLEDTDEEIDEQELEAHYSYMAKIN